jgi:hypothetical protein
MMFSHRRTVAAFTAIVMISGASVAPLAHATADEIAVNGTYLATSDGQWAKTNESYHDEQTVTQTWTITSSCSSFLDCTGHVTSDQGWSADARYLSGVWRVAHTVAGWEACADGTAAPGEQAFQFWPDPTVPPGTLVGTDKTIGPSGACGKNQWLNVTMPFKLVPIG